MQATSQYKVLIKLYAFSCLLMCCVYGESIKADVVMLRLLITL